MNPEVCTLYAILCGRISVPEHLQIVPWDTIDGNGNPIHVEVLCEKEK